MSEILTVCRPHPGQVRTIRLSHAALAIP